MLGSALLAHLGQQLFAEGVAAQSPATQDWLKLQAILRSPAQFHCLLEFFSPSKAILGNAVFAQQSVNSQPRPTSCRSFEIPRQTIGFSPAPSVHSRILSSVNGPMVAMLSKETLLSQK